VYSASGKIVALFPPTHVMNAAPSGVELLKNIFPLQFGISHSLIANGTVTKVKMNRGKVVWYN
jgi:hypothetical protein